MTTTSVSATALALLVATAVPAAAQRTPFTRAFDVGRQAVLDVTTVRGKVDVVASETDRIVVEGLVTVRIGWDVPANAVELAQRVAEDPPVERDGSVVRLAVPSDDARRRAVTVSYMVRVPPGTSVTVATNSGATTVRGVTGPVTVQTQSAAIALNNLGGVVSVRTGSGDVAVDRIAGALSVTTQSSAFNGSQLGGALRVRTGSGAVNAVLTGDGDVDVETQSSSIQLSGVKAGATLASGSGRIVVKGTPLKGAWHASTGSGSIELALDQPAPFQLEASTGSGSVTVKGVSVTGVSSKKSIVGAVDGGGPLVKATSRSGSVRVERRATS